MVAWRISSLLRQRVKNVSVLIPQSAYSAATLVALGGTEIVMHPNGHLGPVDMQISTQSDGGQMKRFSTEDISAFLDFVRNNLKITDQEHVRALFELTCKEVGTLGIGFTARSSKLAIDLGERLLALHMSDEDFRSGKLRSIVESMSKKFHAHNYPVSRKEALDLGLPVNKDRDAVLEKLMWDTWLLLESELKENSPFDPINELLNSSEAKKLLAPVPQMDIPSCVSPNTHFQTSFDDIAKHSKNHVDPVDYEFKSAIVESSRVAHVHVTKGKILSSRTPDMTIRYNLAVISRLWEKKEIPAQAKERKTA